MKKKRNRKNKRKKQSKSIRFSLKNIFNLWWQDKHPVLLFGLAFFTLIIIFYVFLASNFYKNIHPTILHGNATAANYILNLLQQQTGVLGNNISSPIFSINIAKGCDGVEAILLVVAILLAFPAALWKKIVGILTGTTILLLLNILRIIGLFLIGIYAPTWFDFMHIEVGQFVFILFSVAYCAYWIQWVNNI